MTGLGHWASRRMFGAEAALWLGPVLARSMGGVALVLASSLAATLLGLAPPYLTKLLIDQGLIAGDVRALCLWAAALFGLGLVALLAGIGNSLLHLRYSARMLADLRARMLDAVLAQQATRPALPLGEAMARLDGDSAEIQRFAFDSVLVAVGALFRLIGGAAMLLLLDWRLALIPLIAAPIELAFLSWARPRTQARAEDSRQHRGDVSSFLTESLAVLPLLRTLGAEAQRSAGFAPHQAGQIAALWRQRRWQEITGAVPQILNALVRSAVLLAGGMMVIAGAWPLGSLIAFLAYIGLMTGPLRNLLGLYHAQAQAKVAAARLGALADPALAEPAGRMPAPGPGALRFDEARARHAAHAAQDFAIAPGSRVLMDGPSGVGKSTLMMLAARLAPPGPGARVFLDGADVVGLDAVALRRRVALVPQRGALIRGTLAENLRLADPGATDAQLWRVLDCADLADWVQAQGRGLDLPLSEGGAGLSGGERQKIAIARALLLPFRVLVLDESLSEIDAASARRILARIDAAYADRTRILIAHAGPAREGPFDQRITLSPASPACRNARGDAPYQRENARENAV
ncbi:ABC transporter ATP-binding protein [Gemmobacter fulvus]|uniref:ABC transporter ATP-binding protein n=1 Tax=Gemmobacter fulvus TaxID=2840474 RepID=UPI0027967610|nr:ABC transporter ATP-binding protein [Gemmobacter fulvus]MDQ1849939.1 ABC transporter ATP-binding protein [Gemmobacter fulvus]